MELIGPLGVKRAAGAGRQLGLAVTYQGCAEAGLCYPPITRQFKLDISAVTALASDGGPNGSGAGGGGAAAEPPFVSQQDRLPHPIPRGGPAAILAPFFRPRLLLPLPPPLLPIVAVPSSL